ncbi:hypothetical protein Tco_0612422 [Tanacetum coccineum]
MEFIAARKKFFAAKRVEKQRNKPPTKAEQKKKICIYMKHMAGYKDKNFNGKSFDAIKQMIDKAYKQVNDFVPMDTKSSRKKAVSKKRAATKYPMLTGRLCIIVEDKDVFSDPSGLMEVLNNYRYFQCIA